MVVGEKRDRVTNARFQALSQTMTTNAQIQTPSATGMPAITRSYPVLTSMFTAKSNCSRGLRPFHINCRGWGLPLDKNFPCVEAVLVLVSPSCEVTS